MILYEKDGSLYFNLTNRCPTACRFCFKFESGWTFEGKNLRLSGDPTAARALKEIDALLRTDKKWKQAVFCGYGESTYRLHLMRKIGDRFNEHRPATVLRLNTIGLGNLIWKRDIVPDIARFLDEVSISLNTTDPAQWQALHRPAPRYRTTGFKSVCQFIERCAQSGLKTWVTAVKRPDVDLDAVRLYANSVGAHFRERPPLS